MSDEQLVATNEELVKRLREDQPVTQDMDTLANRLSRAAWERGRK
jgi:hypothetical protein